MDWLNSQQIKMSLQVLAQPSDVILKEKRRFPQVNSGYLCLIHHTKLKDMWV